MEKYYFVIEELKTIKKSNEAIMSGVKGINTDDIDYSRGFSEGYIEALKQQNEIITTTIEMYVNLQKQREVC